MKPIQGAANKASLMAGAIFGVVAIISLFQHAWLDAVTEFGVAVAFALLDGSAPFSQYATWRKILVVLSLLVAAIAFVTRFAGDVLHR